MTSLTGAEKPLKIETTGCCFKSLKVKVCSGWVSCKMTSSRSYRLELGNAALQFASMRQNHPLLIKPTVTGICSGSLTACPGVGGQCWLMVNVRVCADGIVRLLNR